MKEIIRTILLEWQERELPEIIEKDAKLDGYLNTDQIVVMFHISTILFLWMNYWNFLLK